jgi:PAS domain S-box-containing protein
VIADPGVIVGKKADRGQAKPLSPGDAGTILDSVVDGVFTVDTEWRITYFNRAAAEITGVDREQAIGERCSEVLRASICETDCALAHTMETGESVVCKPVYIIDTGGGRIPISISTAVLRDSKGNIIGGVETFRDLSLVEQLRKELERTYSFGDMLSKNHRMHKIFDILPNIAQSTSTVLIEGESGTGKELLARAVHDLSDRAGGPFVAVNAAALPDTLLESELFGHKAGAFTDARKDRLGRFALAEGGTIFLDEIGDMSPALQVRLLRVLQDKIYEPLGADESVKADVRVVTATNKNLAQLVKQKKFRQDLYYRVGVVKVTLPPLRERKEDIPLLTEHFIGRLNRLQAKNISGIAPEALALLMKYDFPGNVRELENAIEHAFVVCPGGMIGSSHLPDHLATDGAADRRAGAPASFMELEAQFIISALERNNWNRAATARDLGIDKSTLYRKIRSHGIRLPEHDGRSR